MIEIDLKQIKTMKELKKKLGNKYDEVMYKMNLELLKRMDKAIEYIGKKEKDDDNWIEYELLIEPSVIKDILVGSDKE